VHESTEAHTAPTRLRSGRRSLRRKFLVTLAVGLVIELGLHALHHAGRLKRLEDLGADWVKGESRPLINTATGRRTPLPNFNTSIWPAAPGTRTMDEAWDGEHSRLRHRHDQARTARTGASVAASGTRPRPSGP
jgi:hypothetical protein